MEDGFLGCLGNKKKQKKRIFVLLAHLDCMSSREFNKICFMTYHRDPTPKIQTSGGDQEKEDCYLGLLFLAALVQVVEGDLGVLGEPDGNCDWMSDQLEGGVGARVPEGGNCSYY